MCRKPFTEYRSNLALDALISEVLLTCKFHKFGCTFRALSIHPHLTECIYSKLEPYLIATEKRLNLLENTIVEQSKLINNLQVEIDLQKSKNVQILDDDDMENNTLSLKSNSSWVDREITCQKILTTDTGVSSLACSDLVFTGAYDGTISVFKDNLKLGVVKAHSYSVWSLQLCGDYLYSAGSDGSLKVFFLF
jgi:hypothetical protein